MAPKISVETVIRRNPEAIVASGHGDARPEWLDEWQQWTVIDAVQKQQSSLFRRIFCRGIRCGFWMEQT
ncbi:MAG: hypothetical protein R3E73_01060 [Porticoccaceae bacterium]